MIQNYSDAESQENVAEGSTHRLAVLIKDIDSSRFLPPVLTVTYKTEDEVEQETLQTVIPATPFSLAASIDSNIDDLVAVFDDDRLYEESRMANCHDYDKVIRMLGVNRCSLSNMASYRVGRRITANLARGFTGSR